jgi:hypothetical protein
MKQLAECQIQGTRLKCTEIVARAARQDSTDISAAQATQAGIKRPAATAGPATEAPKAKQARVEQSKQVTSAWTLAILSYPRKAVYARCFSPLRSPAGVCYVELYR